jgi:MutL protein
VGGPVTTVLIEQGRATALTLGPDGTVEATGRGDDLWSAVRDTGAAHDDVIVADVTDTPTAMAIGVIDVLSLQSAKRALGLAGCGVVDSLSINDGLNPDERSRRIVEAAPHVILLAGGTDGGDLLHIEEFAEVIAVALGTLDGVGRPVPGIVYAGNPEARDAVLDILGEGVHHDVDNVRPACERENMASAMVMTGFLAAAAVEAENPDATPPRAWTAGAARSAALHDIARVFENDTLLLHEGPHGAEAISVLGEHWNRVVDPECDFVDAVVRHRALARELSGVPLMRDTSETFVGYVPGRDLLDVKPPTRIIGSGAAFSRLSPGEAAEHLVQVARPRGVVWLSRVVDVDPALLGLAALGGHTVHPDAYARCLADLGLVVSMNGPGWGIRVTLPDGERVVDRGQMTRFPLLEPCTAVLEPLGRGDIGAGPGRPVLRELPALKAGLIVDTRGTSVPPPRRVRILPG